MKGIKLLIDTDIGNDIDDAFAICTAMQSPEVELLAVTTVYGNTAKRAKMAKALLNAGGFGNIPVYAGCSTPLETKTLYGKSKDFTESPAQYDSSFDLISYDGDDAVGSIISLLEKQSTPITILTIGALTNIAKVLMLRSDLKSKIEKIFIMGGGYDHNIEEFNFACDPKAASVVINSELPMYLIGIDVTMKCRLSSVQEKVLSEAQNETLRILWKMRAAWCQSICIHDVLALLCVFSGEQFVRYENRNVDVDFNSHISAGRVVNYSDFNWGRPRKKNQYIAITVENEAAVAECLDRILKFEDMRIGRVTV